MGTVTPNFEPPSTGESWRLQSKAKPIKPLSSTQSLNSPPLSCNSQIHPHLSLQSSAQSVQPTLEADKISPEAVVDEYVLQTGLINEMKTWLCHLSIQEVLPYNPYIELVGKACKIAERFHMFAESREAIQEKIEYPLLTVDGHIARTEHSPPLWGLATTLKSVNVQGLESMAWLMSTMKAEWKFSTSDNEHLYKFHTPVAALVGPCVFIGSFYSETTRIQFRVEFGISGPELPQACRSFAHAVLYDILNMETEGLHLILGIDVAQPDDKLPGNWKNCFWTYDMIVRKQDDFVAAVELFVCKVMRPIVAQCLFKLEKEGNDFKRGEKQYNLNFFKTDMERSQCMSKQPYTSAYDGVFQTRSQFKDYLAWFKDIEPTLAKEDFAGKKEGRKKKKASVQTPQTLPSMGNLTDGAAGSSDKGAPKTGPYSEWALKSIRDNYTNKTAAMKSDENIFTYLHYVILLVILDRHSYSSTVLVEVYRLLHSTAYSLHLLIERNRVLQEIINRFVSSEGQDMQLVLSLFLTYRRTLKEIFVGGLQERSCDFSSAGRILVQMLDDLKVQPLSRRKGRTDTGMLLISSEVVEKLQTINRYCVPFLMSAIDDALTFCPQLVELLPEVDAIRQVQSTHSFKHGFELADIVNQQRQFLVKEDAAKLCSAPPSVAKETVILQYFLDTRVDEVFRDFLTDILNGHYLPPNPFPRLVSTLRAAAIRMELFREPPSRLFKKLCPGSPPLLDTDLFLYHVPGMDAYGTSSALSLLDQKSFSQLSGKVQTLSNTANTNRGAMSGLKTTIGLAVTGFSTLYGRMSPYLHKVELQEHYFIQGPKSAKFDALSVFTRLVFDHLTEFEENEEVLFDGVFLGAFGSKTGVKWTLRDVIHPQRRNVFTNQFKSVVKAKTRVYIKVYLKMDWRFVLVEKDLLLHFVEGQHFLGYERFYNPTNAVAFYQSVFLNQKVALLYARLCGPKDKKDPFLGENLELSLVHIDHYIELEKAHGNLLATYRWLLLRSLIKQDAQHVVDAWRMTHSTAARLEYLQSLNSTIQSIVLEELCQTFRPVREDTERKSLLDREFLSMMMEAYVQKLESVLTNSTCFASPFLRSVITKILQKVATRDPMTGRLTILIEKEIPKHLNEVNELLRSLIVTSSWDLHHVCPGMQHALLEKSGSQKT